MRADNLQMICLKCRVNIYHSILRSTVSFREVFISNFINEWGTKGYNSLRKPYY